MANPTRGIGGIGSTRGHSAMVESTRGIRGIGSTRGHLAMVKSTRGDFLETTRGIGLTRGEEHQGSRKGILQSGSRYDLAAALRRRRFQVRFDPRSRPRQTGTKYQAGRASARVWKQKNNSRAQVYNQK
jgi:hypothetical protein